MDLTVRLFAGLRDRAGAEHLLLRDLQEPVTIATVKAAAVAALEELDPAALAWALRHRKRRDYPLLLATGATIPPGADDAYLRKVAAAGGFPAYEKAHRRALATKFVAKAFPCLPTDVTAQVASFAFHVGYY